MSLLMVSNRLPITVAEEDGCFSCRSSAGGLATALQSWSLANADAQVEWHGWPGLVVKPKDKDKLKAELLNSHCYPIFLSKKDVEEYYYGFCNKTIWPLFHYFPNYTGYDNDQWNAYVKVNQTYCDQIVQAVKPGDMLWIHDYQLFLLPKMLKEKLPGTPIGFFLHIPFPNLEIYRILPKLWRTEILKGILGADLIGFHTADYTRYFVRCVNRLLGYESDATCINLDNRSVRVDTFPISINYRAFNDNAKEEKTYKRVSEIKNLARGSLILSVDRLDYSKGILNRLKGYELFLRRNPGWHERTTLILIVVPSREGVEHYTQMKRQIDEIVGTINGNFGKMNWTPIIYQYRCLPLDELVPYYAACDVALVTPLRDGMNLVAKEYVASRVNKTGVLILSEMAGAVSELGEAVIINPNNIEEITSAIAEALDMPLEEQIRRNNVMQAQICRCDVNKWAADYISSLTETTEWEEDLKRSSTNAR